MNIRTAQPSDCSQLATWLEALYQHVLARSQDPYFRDCLRGTPADALNWFEMEIAQGPSILLVAEEEGALRGFIQGYLDAPYALPSSILSIGYIGMIWVDPKYRRHGTGGLLVEAMERRFRDLGLGYVDLHYLIGNAEAEAAWERLGYVPYRVASRKVL